MNNIEKNNYESGIQLKSTETVKLQSIFDECLKNSGAINTQILFNDDSTIQFEDLYSSIDISNFGSRSSKNCITINDKNYKIPRGSILAKMIQLQALHDTDDIKKMSINDIKRFCDGKIGKNSQIQIQKGNETKSEIKQTQDNLRGSIQTEGIVSNKNNSEYMYELGESLRNLSEAKKYAQALLKSSELLQNDPTGENGEQIFNVNFNVDMTPVVKEKTKIQINKEFESYSKIAQIILSDENYSFLRATTTERKGGYDSVYNARLGFNRAMNAIISTYLIGIPSKKLNQIYDKKQGGINKATDFYNKLENAQTLSELILIFQQGKDNAQLPKYSFTFKGDGLGQSKYFNKRVASSNYNGQFKGKETKDGKEIYKFVNRKLRNGKEEIENWEMNADPRTTSSGSFVVKDSNGRVSGGGSFGGPKESDYRDGIMKRF